jgi:hypothetical protein
MITAEQCAAETVAAAESRHPLLITPIWYTPIVLLRKLFPSLVDKLLIRIFAPTPKKKT